jgi:two-component system, NtrC family, sensor kinase
MCPLAVFANLQIKVMLLFVLLALAPLGIMGALAIKTAEELIISMVKNQIQHVAADKATLLERWISERKADLEVIAGSSILRSLDREQIIPYLDLVRDRYKVYSELFIVSLDGGIVQASSPQAANLQRRDWFRTLWPANPTCRKSISIPSRTSHFSGYPCP